MKESSHKIAASQSVVHAALDGEAVLLNVETGIYFGLDPVGTRIWELVLEEKSEEEIVAQLHTEYDVSREQLDVDVHAFLSRLEAKGLVESRV